MTVSGKGLAGLVGVHGESSAVRDSFNELRIRAVNKMIVFIARRVRSVFGIGMDLAYIAVLSALSALT